MTLSEYLKAHDLTQQQFAAKAGTTQAAIARYTSGKRMPNREQMAKIVAATFGEVTANDFYTMKIGAPTDPVAA